MSKMHEVSFQSITTQLANCPTLEEMMEYARNNPPPGYRYVPGGDVHDSLLFEPIPPEAI